MFVILVLIADACLTLPFLAEAFGLWDDIGENEGHGVEEGVEVHDHNSKKVNQMNTAKKVEATSQGRASEERNADAFELKETLRTQFGMVEVAEVAKQVAPADFSLWWNHTRTSREYTLKAKLGVRQESIRHLCNHLERRGFSVIA